MRSSADGSSAAPALPLGHSTATSPEKTSQLISLISVISITWREIKEERRNRLTTSNVVCSHGLMALAWGWATSEKRHKNFKPWNSHDVFSMNQLVWVKLSVQLRKGWLLAPRHCRSLVTLVRYNAQHWLAGGYSAFFQSHLRATSGRRDRSCILTATETEAKLASRECLNWAPFYSCSSVGF